MKACANDGIELVAVLVCSIDNLRTIAPDRANAMVSLEKLTAELEELDGIIDIPLMVGELIPKDF